MRVAEKPAVRLPIGDEKSRYDFRGSGVATGGGRLYLGTHDGRVLALAPGGAERIWEFQAGDSVVATPLVISDKVYFGSFDGSVYALDAASGAQLWKHDTGAPVTSSPAFHDGLVVVGSRSYDLLALDGKTGRPAWTRYYWFSWVESPATILDGSVYVGSSDAAKLFAFEAGTGRPHLGGRHRREHLGTAGGHLGARLRRRGRHAALPGAAPRVDPRRGSPNWKPDLALSRVRAGERVRESLLLRIRRFARARRGPRLFSRTRRAHLRFRPVASGSEGLVDAEDVALRVLEPSSLL